MNRLEKLRAKRERLVERLYKVNLQIHLEDEGNEVINTKRLRVKMGDVKRKSVKKIVKKKSKKKTEV